MIIRSVCGWRQGGDGPPNRPSLYEIRGGFHDSLMVSLRGVSVVDNAAVRAVTEADLRLSRDSLSIASTVEKIGALWASTELST